MVGEIKSKFKESCSCISDRKWNMLMTIGFIVFGAVMILPAFAIEVWTIKLSGASLLIAVVFIAPVTEEVLKAFPILFDFVDDFKDRLKFVLIVGFMFGTAEWMVHFYTMNETLSFGFILHIIFMTPLLFGYNRNNKVGNYIALGINIGLHMVWNLVVLGGLI